MSIKDDLENDGIQFEENSINAAAPMETAAPEEERKRIDIIEFITRETGQGELGEYVNHPLNFNSSSAMARIIRGVTGLFGKSLKFALLDIAAGLIEMTTKKKVPINE